MYFGWHHFVGHSDDQTKRKMSAFTTSCFHSLPAMWPGVLRSHNHVFTSMTDSALELWLNCFELLWSGCFITVTGIIGHLMKSSDKNRKCLSLAQNLWEHQWYWFVKKETEQVHFSWEVNEKWETKNYSPCYKPCQWRERGIQVMSW